jgi:hypothetical protein
MIKNIHSANFLSVPDHATHNITTKVISQTVFYIMIQWIFVPTVHCNVASSVYPDLRGGIPFAIRVTLF